MAESGLQLGVPPCGAESIPFEPEPVSSGVGKLVCKPPCALAAQSPERLRKHHER